MISRHPFAATAIVTFGVTVVLYTIGILAGWSNEALGWALLGSILVGALVRGLGEKAGER